MIKLSFLCSQLDAWLQPSKFIDYAPNGLQVEGKGEISKLGLAVSASKKIIEAAIEWEADALLVHHGFFWKGESQCLTGMKGSRIKALMANDLSLIAYHLPLDHHLEFGNNIALKKRLSLDGEFTISEIDKLVANISLYSAIYLDDCVATIERELHRKPILVRSPLGRDPIRKIAICTGGAQEKITVAHQDQCDLFISGEISERTTHEARELGVHYISAGHHASERYGVQALGAKISNEYSVITQFFEEFNPA